MEFKNLKKIAWAVDALEDSQDREPVSFFLGSLTRATGAEVIPTYIMGSPFAHFSGQPVSKIEAAFVALAEKRLQDFELKGDVEKIKPAKVLYNATGSTRGGVESLMNFVKGEGIDAVVVATHARKALSRAFLGSFAETLILSADVPVFTVNPETKVRERISRILLPTTFQPRFRPQFERVVALAKKLEAHLTLFYKEPEFPSTFVSPEDYWYMDQEVKMKSKSAEAWQGWSIKNGVSTEVHLDSQPGPVADAITAFAAERNVDLIAMSSEATRVSAILMGSVTRQVIRSAACPVMCLRYEEPREVENKMEAV